MVLDVRPARESDTEAIVALVGQLQYQAEASEVADRLEDIARDSEAVVLVAESEGCIAGWIHVYGVTWVQMGRFAGVGGMVVADGWRGQGIGSRLLGAAEAWAVEQGYPVIRVRSNVIREQAHSFYQDRGYRTEKQLFSFLKTL